MKKSHLNILIPQWQGGGPDLSTYTGGRELKNNYLSNSELTEIEVSTQNISQMKYNIIGYGEILKQLTNARSQVAQKHPDTIFTIGGGCDADITAISYLNCITDSDITILYFDAHGDLHTPESSISKLFYGMPLRTLFGEGDKKIINLLFSKLLPSQVIMLGIRDLDKEELDYIKKHNISVLKSNDIDNNVRNVIETAKSKHHKNIYVHIDLDVLDPAEFPYVPVPAPAGIKCLTLINLLKKLNEEFNIIGLGLFEYSPSNEKKINLIQEIMQIGCSL